MEDQQLVYIRKQASLYKDLPTQLSYFPAEIETDEKQFFKVKIGSSAGFYFWEEFYHHKLYEPTGYYWAGLIKQLLKNKNQDLLTKVKLDPEADTCHISCSSKESMMELAVFIHENCSTRELMNKVLIEADKTILD